MVLSSEERIRLNSIDKTKSNLGVFVLNSKYKKNEKVMRQNQSRVHLYLWNKELKKYLSLMDWWPVLETLLEDLNREAIYGLQPDD